MLFIYLFFYILGLTVISIFIINIGGLWAGATTFGIGTIYLIYLGIKGRKPNKNDPVGTVYSKSNVNGFKYRIEKGVNGLIGLIGVKNTEQDVVKANAEELFTFITFEKNYYWYKCTEGTNIGRVSYNIEEASYNLASRDKIFYTTHCLSTPKDK